MYRHLCVALLILAGVMVFPPFGWTEPMARVGSWILEQEDVDKGLSGKFYELREARVQALVLEHLLLLEAATLKMESSEILNKQVISKVSQPSKAEISQFIAANKDRLPDGGKGMEDRIREYLLEKRQDVAKEAYLKGLWDKHAVEILLQAPRFEVDGPQDLSRGPADAPMTVIEFSDFECPYCRRAQATLQKVSAVYGDKVRFVFRHYPLPFHNQAPKASEAAQCAADQGKFWPFHDALFEKGASLLPVDLKKLAGKLALNQANFDACLDSGHHADRVAKDTAVGKGLGISGTPTFFINGIRLVGAVPFEAFKKVMDAELALKNKVH